MASAGQGLEPAKTRQARGLERLETQRRWLRGGTLALIAAVCLVFFTWVGDYGPGYDELIGDFQYGERTLFFLFTGDRRYLDLLQPVAPREIWVEGHQDLASPYGLEGPFVHGHGAATVSAALCWLAFRTLGILSAVEAHHAVNCLFALALVVVLFRCVSRAVGVLAGWLAVAFWFAQPRLVAEFFFNIKDFPEACLFGLTVLVFWAAWEGKGRPVQDSRREAGKTRKLLGGRRVGLLVASAALWGFALSVKINAAFLPLILVPWTWLVGTSETRKEGSIKGTMSSVLRRLLLGLGRTLLVFLLHLPVSAAAFFVSWPYLWLHPEELWRHVAFVLQRGHTGELQFDLMPLAEWMTATPEVVLVGSLAGALWGMSEKDPARRRFLLLVLLWYAMPLVRANVPGMRHYDGIRHFLEVTVPAAILAGYGWARVAGWLGGCLAMPAQAATLGIALLAAAAPFPQVHPYELAYFNSLSGGLKGARAGGHPDAGDYWAASYRQGVRWLNRHAKPGSVLAVPFAEHLVGLTRGSADGLREDIRLLHVNGPFELEAGKVYVEGYQDALRQGPVYVMFVPRRSWENAIIRHARRHGRQVFPGGKVWGIDALSIYKVPAMSPPEER